MDKETFVNRANKVHNNRYDYSKTIYVNSHEKIIVTCPEHGDFIVLPYNHLNGHKCPYCGLSKKTTKDFIIESKKIHGDKYDYSETEYKSANEKLKIYCPKHGYFLIRASSHLSGCGCKKCASELSALSQKKTTQEFINEAKSVHGNRYNYSKTDYINANTKVCIICPKHGEFWQVPTAHTTLRQGCPNCKNSKMGEFIENMLKKAKIKYEKEKTFDWLKYECNMRLDFFLPEKKIAIECQGSQHFRSIKRFGGDEGFLLRKKRDEEKNRLLTEHGIKIIYLIPKRHKNKIGTTIYDKNNSFIFCDKESEKLLTEEIMKLNIL